MVLPYMDNQFSEEAITIIHINRNIPITNDNINRHIKNLAIEIIEKCISFDKQNQYIKIFNFLEFSKIYLSSQQRSFSLSYNKRLKVLIFSNQLFFKS